MAGQDRSIEELRELTLKVQKKIKDVTILCVDDDAITRKQLSQYLKSQCKILYVAKDGEEGLALYKNFKPDIVITDIEMPSLNGLEMAKKVREISTSTQIIIITAYKSPQYLMEAVNLQLVQYLIKPISLDKITQVLNFTSNFIDEKEIETRKYFDSNFYYDTYTRELISNNTPISLSKHERALVELLIKKFPAPVSYELIDSVIYDYGGSRNAIKLLVRSLRNKIKKSAVTNIPGFGYKLESEASL